MHAVDFHRHQVGPAQARRILKEAVSAPDHLGDFALGIFGPKHDVDLQLPERTPHEPLDLTE